MTIKPKISVVIIAYNMSREVPRTVQSFMPGYQRGLETGDVEIIIVENGSDRPVSAAMRTSWPSSVRYHIVEQASPSPAAALNLGVQLAAADLVRPVIDGARMASPGLLSQALRAYGLFDDPFIATLGCHLGHKLQQQAAAEGYDQQVEDALLDSIAWPADGYRLFDIACVGGSGKSAWLGFLSESNAPVLSKSLYDALGGYDERFDTPGGGLVNLDFFNRAVSARPHEYVLLAGEATFHQYHGGVTTTRPVRAPDPETGISKWDIFEAQYRRLRGEAWDKPRIKPILFGQMSGPAERLLQRALNDL